MKALAPARQHAAWSRRGLSARSNGPSLAGRLGDSIAQRAALQRALRSHDIQPKVKVAPADDRREREADAVAERVVQNRPAPVPGFDAGAPGAGLQRKAAKASEDDDLVQKKAARPEDEEKQIRRKARPEEEDKVRRKARPDDEEPIARKARTGGDSGRSSSFSSVAAAALANRGSGSPLLCATRSRLESSMGVDLGRVRVHESSADRKAADALSARAFTHGGDIWLGSGESQHDVRLMAHETAHVVQQHGTAEQGVVQRLPTVSSPPPAPPDAPAPGEAPAATPDVSNSAPPTLHLPTLEVPSFKQEWHQSKLANINRRASYLRGRPAQVRVWERDVSGDGGATKLGQAPYNFLDDHTYRIEGPNGIELMGGTAALARRMRRPFWRKDGSAAEKHEVDHKVELQVSGWPDSSAAWANEVPNMAMLNASANSESGRLIQQRLENGVKEFLRDPAKNAQLAPAYRLPAGTTGAGPLQQAARRVLSHYTVRFRGVSGFSIAAPASIYEKSEIESGDHIGQLQNTPGIKLYDMLNPSGGGVFDAHTFNAAEVIGSAARFVVYYKEHGGRKVHFAWPSGGAEQKDASGDEQHRIRGMRISKIEFHPRQDPIGVVEGRFFTRQQQYVQDATGESYRWQIRRFPGTDYAGYLDPDGFKSWVRGRFGSPQFSPIEFDEADVDEDRGGVRVGGRIQSSLPILRDVGLDIALAGDDLRVEKHFATGDFSLPGPVQVTDSSLTLSIGTESGLGIEGEVLFQIPSVGSGRLSGAASTGTGGGPSFGLGGEFNVERGPFDPARVVVRYRDGVFSGEGEFGIRAGTVPGIRSARIQASLTETGFSAAGTAELSVPGVQRGTMNVAYSEAEGLRVGGGFELANNIPGIQGGSLNAELRERPDGSGWAVSARGTARPRIPGVNSELTVAYDDGAITAQATASYARGMLSGSLEVGAANRVIGENGQPTDAVGDTLHAFGSGRLTIRLTPWLEGTVGVRILPNGEIELMGEIGLPGQLEIFPRRQIERRLLNIAVQIPIVPGIVAEIGGGLTAQAGIGPGVLDQLRIGITYNPSHEENTHITGDAHLNVPADAGLRLSVRAGIGLGITGASATGGLEIGALAGIAGAAEAGVHVDWTPTTGLRIDAFGALHSQPRFRFDVSGYVSVRALGFEVYGKRWELAAFEFGSDLRLGVRFPISYVEGQPFQVDLSRVEFEVPDIQPRQMLDALIDRIA